MGNIQLNVVGPESLNVVGCRVTHIQPNAVQNVQRLVMESIKCNVNGVELTTGWGIQLGVGGVTGAQGGRGNKVVVARQQSGNAPNRNERGTNRGYW